MNDLLSRLKKAARISVETSQADQGLFVLNSRVLRCSHCGGDEFKKGSVEMTWMAGPGKTRIRRAIHALECVRCSRLELCLDAPRLIDKT